MHILCAYWGFVCMSLHLGFHWSMIPTLLSLDTLEERGITLNTAYAVVAAYSVGDFLAFTLQFSPAHALPMMAGRLLSGLLAVVLCLKTTPKTT